MQRLVTGLVLAVGMALLVFLGTPTVFRVAVAVIGVLAAVELARIGQRLAANPALWWMPGTVLFVALWQGGFFELQLADGFVALFLLGCVPALGALLSSRGGEKGRDPQEAPKAAALLSFGTAYLGAAAVAMMEIHSVDRWLFFLVVAIVAVSDTAAYYGGKATGRHKLAPSVSPNKTIEGSLWGLACAVAFVAGYSLLRLERLEPTLLLVGLLTAVAGQLGDLVESLFKRAAGVKDSGAILPGHGGVLDRLDALLLASPVFYLGLLLVGSSRFVP